MINEKELEQRLLRIDLRLNDIDRQLTALHKEHNELTKRKANIQNMVVLILSKLADLARIFNMFHGPVIWTR